MAACTYSDYVHIRHGRNCEGCREANAEYKRAKKADNRANAQAQIVETGVACLAALNDNITCGALTSYSWYCCRGAACKAARQEQSLIHDNVVYAKSA